MDVINVLVISYGGVILRSAISQIKRKDLNNKVLDKRLKNDTHTLLADSVINASLGNFDEEDSW